jgi:3-hydroxyisobutyrate dehydrogenase-like beta-hydroxyacid dehydrogenase
VAVVGVIGLGDIGKGVATAVVKAGFETVVCDVRAEATQPFEGKATVVSDVGEAGRLCDVIAVAVVTDEQVLAVLGGDGGVVAQMKPGSVVVILSTVSAGTVATVADLAEGKGVGVVDCGVSGGPSAAAEGALVAMVGGEDDCVERVRPVLDAFSSLVVRMGPLGAGLQAKLARNIVQYGSWFAAFEAQRLAEAAGIELSKLAEVIRASDKKIGGASTLMFRSTAEPFGADDDAGLVQAMRTAASLAHKDLSAALDLAGRLGLELPMTALAERSIDGVFGMASEARS